MLTKHVRKAQLARWFSSSTSTVDSNEVRKFANLNWWGRQAGKEGNDAANQLKVMHDARVKAIREAIEASPRLKSLIFQKPGGFSALDVGCGGGLMTTTLKSDFGASRVLGIDASETGINAATSYAKQHELDIDYQCTSPEKLDPSKAKFDLVCALEVVEHVSDRDAFLQSCANLCEGVLVVSTMSRSLSSWLLAIAAAEHVARMVPRGTHDWRKFVNVSEIEESIVHRKFAGKKQFHTEALIKLIYNPVTGSWTYSRNDSESFMPLCNYIYIASV